MYIKDENKDFFDQVLILTSKDSNLTKAHVKFLESTIVELMREVDRVTLSNGNTPPKPALPRPDRDAMHEFLGPARLLMAALGFLALQPLTRPQSSATALGSTESRDGPSGPLAETVLYLKVPKNGVSATGLATDEGLVVKKGSVGDIKIRDSLSKGWRTLRLELVSDGSIVERNGQICFERDVVFRSPSAASSVIAGGARNGRKGWRNAAGTSLGELEDQLLSNEPGAHSS